MPSGTAAFSVLWYVGGLSGPVVAGYAMDLWNPYGMAATVATACAVLVAASAVAAVSGRAKSIATPRSPVAPQDAD
jgi:hypothetical protein